MKEKRLDSSLTLRGKSNLSTSASPNRSATNINNTASFKTPINYEQELARKRAEKAIFSKHIARSTIVMSTADDR
jgi:hypothetical protein